MIIRAETDDDDRSDSFKLRPGATSSKRLTIDHEQGDDEIQITLTGEDDLGIEHELSWEIPIEHIDREHDLDIIEARLTPSQVSCDAPTMLGVRIENRGRSDERGSILIKKDPLGLEIEQDLNIERDETSIFNFNITLRGAPSGHWSIPLEVLSSDRKILARSEASLEVLGCLKHVTSVAQSIAETPEPAKVRAQTRQTNSSPSRTSSFDPLIWFIGFVLAANIIVAAVLVTIVLKKRR